jgi:hypothetical protein
MVSNIYPILRHYLYSFRVYAMRFDTGTVNFCLTTGKMFQVTMSNLTPATVAGT